MANDIGPKIGIEGEKEFKSALADINKDMQVLGSELGKTASQFDLSGNAMEGNKAKADVLSKQLQTQKDKVELLKSALANAASSFGQTDNRTKDWQISLNKAEAELAQTEKKLNDVKNSTNKLGDEFDKAGKKSLSFSDILKANLLSNAISSGISALGSAIKSAVSDAFEGADNIQKLADQTGLTAEKVQELDYVGKTLGVDIETITGAQAKLTKAMSSARDGTGAQAEAFKALGISVTDAGGNLKDAKSVMYEAFDSLKNVGNETERDALSMSLFGKSAKDLNPLIKAGSGEMEKLAKQARDTGAIMSNETVSALDDTGDTMDQLKQSVIGAAGSFMAKFTPELKNVAEGIKGVLSGQLSLEDFMKTIGELVEKAADTITENLPTIITTGIKLVISLVTGLLKGLPKIIEAMPQIVDAVWDGITGVDWLELGSNIILGIWNGILNLGGWLANKVKNFFKINVVGSAENELDINSPSKVFEKIGQFTAMGFGEGFGDEMKTVSASVKGALPTDFNISTTLSGSVKPYAEPTRESYITSNLYMDSVIVASQTAKAQYRRNVARARAYGMA